MDGSLRAASYSVLPGAYHTSKGVDRSEVGRTGRRSAHTCRSIRGHWRSIACSGETSVNCICCCIRYMMCCSHVCGMVNRIDLHKFPFPHQQRISMD